MNETTKAVLSESTLTAIAEAIRQKSSSSAALKPSEMPEAIKNIKSGGGKMPTAALSQMSGQMFSNTTEEQNS